MKCIYFESIISFISYLPSIATEETGGVIDSKLLIPFFRATLLNYT